MARSANNDPIEKFRFVVTIFGNEQSLGGFTTGGLTSSSSIAVDEDNKTFIRGGFSEVIPPEANIKDIAYRENIHGGNSIKVPGLVTYQDVILKRGVTQHRDMFNWFKQVSDTSIAVNKYAEGLAGLSAVPFQEPNYRREVLISCMDRAGSYKKHWLLYNAWPKGYKGADSLDAKSSEIALEQVTLAYETFLECKGDTIIQALQDAQNQAEDAAKKAATASLIGAFTGLFG